MERLYDRTERGPLASPNDIVFDGHGGFWFTDLGSMGETALERGRICYAKADGSMIREVVFPMLTPNGIGLSPDGVTLYVAETVTARVWAFEVAGPGELRLRGWPELSPGRLLYASGIYCMDDSLAVEEGGNVCVATIGAPGIAGVSVLSPAGEILERVHMPDRSSTNLCFGGSDRRTGYVTLSRSGRLERQRWLIEYQQRLASGVPRPIAQRIQSRRVRRNQHDWSAWARRLGVFTDLWLNQK